MKGLEAYSLYRKHLEVQAKLNQNVRIADNTQLLTNHLNSGIGKSDLNTAIYFPDVYYVKDLPRKLNYIIAEEFGELLQSLDYVWWKKREFCVKDYLNIILELVDIYHFILTQSLILTQLLISLREASSNHPNVIDDIIYHISKRMKVSAPTIRQLIKRYRKDRLGVNNIERFNDQYITDFDLYNEIFNVIVYYILSDKRHKEFTEIFIRTIPYTIRHTEPNHNLKKLLITMFEKQVINDYHSFDITRDLSFMFNNIELATCKVNDIILNNRSIFNLKRIFDKRDINSLIISDLYETDRYILLSIKSLFDIAVSVSNYAYHEIKFEWSEESKLCSLLATTTNYYDVYKAFDMFYLGKSVLNKFRYENGYKDGTYIKKWEDGEDNDYLISYLLGNMDVLKDLNHKDFEESVYSFLSSVYDDIVRRS